MGSEIPISPVGHGEFGSIASHCGTGKRRPNGIGDAFGWNRTQLP